MNNLLGPPTGYTDLLDEATRMKLTEEKGSWQKSPLRPSAAGGCTRELYYQLMEYAGKAKYETEVNQPEVHRLLNLGHSIESHIIRQFELLKDVFELRYKQQVLSFRYLEAKNNPKLSQWVEGSLDTVFWSEKWKCVTDFKSKKDKFSYAYKSQWDETSDKLSNLTSVERISESAFWVENLEDFLAELKDPFFSANFLQLNLYANSSFLKERGVNHGSIIQYCKNDSRLREVRFKPSGALYEKVLSKFTTVLNAVDQDKEELAKRDYSLGSIKCAFCKYKNECWESDALKAFFSTFPKKDWPTDTPRMGAEGAELEKQMLSYEKAISLGNQAKQLEQAIASSLVEAGINKFRLANGNIYEVRRLKDSIVLRRGKL